MKNQENIKNRTGLALYDLIEMARAEWQIIVVITIIFAIATVVWSLSITPQWTASAKIILRSGNMEDSPLAEMANLTGIMNLPQETSPAMYLDQAVKDSLFLEGILQHKWYYHGDSVNLEQMWSVDKKEKLKEPWAGYQRAKLIEKARKEKVVTISRDPKTGILNVMSNARDPKVASDICKFALVGIDLYLQNSFRSTARAKRMFIEQRIKEAEQDLANSEKQITEFHERNETINAPRLKLEDMELERNLTINENVYTTLRQKYESARVDEKNDQPVLEIIRNPEIPLTRTKPQRSLMVVAGVILGLSIGYFIAFVRQTNRKYPYQASPQSAGSEL